MDARASDLDFSDHLISQGSRKTLSGDGTVSLKWRLPTEGGQVELQQASNPSFADPMRRYAGPEEGSVITGLPEGSHYFRLRAIDPAGRPGPWSAPFEVQVAFMERGRLILLLALGGMVVALTAGAIISGHLRTRPAR